MRKFLIVSRRVLADLARLKLPVTAAALTTTLVGIAGTFGVRPFGIDLSQQTTRITAALTLVGLIASVLQRYAASASTSTPVDEPVEASLDDRPDLPT